MFTKNRILSIWSFVGFIFMIYGLLIFSAGIYYLFTPPKIELNYLHSSIWWGALLFLTGYVFNFFDMRNNRATIQ